MASQSNSALARLIKQIIERKIPDYFHPHVGPAGRYLADPQPNPWNSGITSPDIMQGAMFARTVIDHAASTLRTAAAIGGAEAEKRALGIVSNQVMEDIDDCGNGRRPPHWPWPWPGPWKFKPDDISPVDMFVAATVFQSYADQFSDRPLAATFAKAADTLISVAAKQLEAPAAR